MPYLFLYLSISLSLERSIAMKKIAALCVAVFLLGPYVAEACLGDVDCDGVVDGSDLALFADSFGDAGCSACADLLNRIEALEEACQSGGCYQNYQNVIDVAKSGGDYTSVQAAIDSITDAATDNPYLVRVAPGEYSETVTMKPYVHLQGAGQEVTIITSTTSNGSLPPSQATLVLASDVSLRDLTVGNSGSGIQNVALLASAGVTRTLVADVTVRAHGGGEDNYAIFLIDSGTGVRLQQVTALGENGSYSNFGLYNYNGAAATLRGGSFTGRGGSIAGAISNSGSGTTLETESVTALAENGSSSNYGLYNNNGAAATLRGGSFTGRGGSIAGAISNSGSGTTLETESVTALAENGSSSNYGLYNDNGATANITQSVLEGASYSVNRISGNVTVSHSRLVGGSASGTVTCVLVTRGTSISTDGATCP
jgi:hypothetical protein